ncbi:MAG: RHS repeat-associated core domain-containing protein [Actinomycetota bacterium]|nr:RHS repeat-associated core domain-containing protein [Actinomycetota bacterium]
MISLSFSPSSTLNYRGQVSHSCWHGGDGVLSGGRIYDPYGNLLSDTVDSSLGYQEDYTDPTSGMVWMGARWYSPELARFISEDPLSGDPTEPLSLNSYLYCEDDPINSFDPTGARTRSAQEIMADIQGVEWELGWRTYLRLWLSDPAEIAHNENRICFCLMTLASLYMELAEPFIDPIGTAEDIINPGQQDGSGIGGEPPPESAEDILRGILNDVNEENEAALEGSLGQIMDAALSMSPLGFRDSDAWYLNGLTEEERMTIWSCLNRNLTPGYTENYFDGKFLVTIRWDNGVPTEIGRELAYSGQEKIWDESAQKWRPANEKDEDYGPLPEGFYWMGENAGALGGSYGDFYYQLNWLTGETFERSGFAVHQDDGGLYSQGCVVMHTDNLRFVDTMTEARTTYNGTILLIVQYPEDKKIDVGGDKVYQNEEASW